MWILHNICYKENTMVYILDAVRTPVGRFMKSFVDTPAVMLGAECVKSLLHRTRISPHMVQDVIIGHVLTAGLGMNTARQVAIHAGLPYTTPALTINQVCGSGLRSVIMGVQSVQSGLDCVIAGGQENMSLSHFSAYYNRKHPKKSPDILQDTLLTDGLTCAIDNTHMGITAENLAQKYSISREQQDIYALNSHKKAQYASKNGHFANEIIAINRITVDEHIRLNIQLSDLQQLKTVFKKDGTVTAGNASGINDGASMVLLGSEPYVNTHNIKPLARIVAYGVSGVSPHIMGIAPVQAVKNALKTADWHIDDLDIIESNEAFAAQAIAVNTELGWDTDKVNINGGAIAIGHPIGASGTRILTTLVHTLHRLNKQKGIATLCVGGGMGVAVCVEVC